MTATCLTVDTFLNLQQKCSTFQSRHVYSNIFYQISKHGKQNQRICSLHTSRILHTFHYVKDPSHCLLHTFHYVKAPSHWKVSFKNCFQKSTFKSCTFEAVAFTLESNFRKRLLKENFPVRAILRKWLTKVLNFQKRSVNTGTFSFESDFQKQLFSVKVA